MIETNPSLKSRLDIYFGRRSPERKETLPNVEALRQEQTAIREMIADLEKNMRNQRSELSAEIRAAISPTYRELVREICIKLVDAYEAYSRYARLISLLNSRGVNWTELKPMHPRFLFEGDVRSQGHLAIFLRNAAASGFIDAAQIPEGLRDASVGLSQSDQRAASDEQAKGLGRAGKAIARAAEMMRPRK